MHLLLYTGDRKQRHAKDLCPRPEPQKERLFLGRESLDIYLSNHVEAGR